MKNNTNELKAVTLSITEQTEKVTTCMDTFVQTLNSKSNGNGGKAREVVNKHESELKQEVDTLNKLLARQYYLSTPLFDIIKSGKACPVKVYTCEQDDNGKYSVKLGDDLVYPTLSGLDKSGLLPEGFTDRVDLLRREVAYLESKKTAKEFLYGDVENKKDIPSKSVAAMIEAEKGDKDISVNKAKSTMQTILHDLTDGEYKKEVFSKLYNDFAKYITKRSAEWGKRNMVARSVAGDMVLEYAYMYFNDLREVKYSLA